MISDVAVGLSCGSISANHRSVWVLAPARRAAFHALAQRSCSSLRHGSLTLQAALLLGQDPRVVQRYLLRFPNQFLQFAAFFAA